MKVWLATGACILLLAGCERLPAQLSQASAPVGYEPGAAGTVDHALCLLGFTGAPLSRLATGHHLIEGELNGVAARFILDTGANASVLHAAHAETFNLSAQGGMPGVAMGLGGNLRASRAPIESLTLGDVPIRRDAIMIADLSQLEALLGRLSSQPIHGIIGQDVMGEHRAVVDVARPMLHLQADDAEPAPVDAARCTPEEPSAAG